MSTQQYSELRQRAQGDGVMRCRVWNENLSAFFVSAPLVVPPPVVDAPVASAREGVER